MPETHVVGDADGDGGDGELEEARAVPCLAEDAEMASWLGFGQEGSLFDPSWSWFQAESQGETPFLLDQALGGVLEWTSSGAPDPAASSIVCGTASWHSSAFSSD